MQINRKQWFAKSRTIGVISRMFAAISRMFAAISRTMGFPQDR